MAESATTLLRSGPDGAKTNIVVIGDGFTAAEQGQFNDYVDKELMSEVFSRGFFAESKQAFNIVRVNIDSAESGVSQRTYDADGNVIASDDRDTALDTIYNGNWDFAWIEEGETRSRIASLISRLSLDMDYVLIILNEDNFGGVARGLNLYVTTGVDWSVIAHELGHGLGQLADEYCDEGPYTGSSDLPPNLTTETRRSRLKWRNFVKPSTPIPTGVKPSTDNGGCTDHNQGTRPSDWDQSQDVGLFEGARYRDSGIYRPVENCRMRSNRPEFCPVCYTHLKNRHHSTSEQTFERVYTGDFNGDGKDELLIHSATGLQMYRPVGYKLEMMFSVAGVLPGSWQIAPNDQYFVGDFNGDGADELVVFNGRDWNKEYLGMLALDGTAELRLVRRYDDRLSGWSFGRNDRFHVGDFDGNGTDDLIVFNGDDWNKPYLGMLKSNGSSLSVARRYDAEVEGWQMRKNDQVLVGDFDGDGKAGVCIANTKDWGTKYLGLMSSTGSKLKYDNRYDNSISGWQMEKEDRFYVGDFNGDGKDDLYVFNGENWDKAYLGMLRSTGRSFSLARRYDGNAPGWNMRKHDQHFVADIDGNGNADLFVYNHRDWSSPYLGTMISNGSSLRCRWSNDRVGEWNLGSSDSFEVCNFEGGRNRRNLVVHNKDWLGLIRATPSLSLQRIYKHWIHNFKHGRNW